MKALRAALDRTLLLMRDEFNDEVSDEKLLEALVNTTIALVADDSALASNSTQSAYITAAILLARSGHTVHLIAPDVPLLTPQLPLRQGNLITSLLALNGEILPGTRFLTNKPKRSIDLVVKFGPESQNLSAETTVAIAAEPWSACITTAHKTIRWARPCSEAFGGMAGGALIAAEAFKSAMRKLRDFAHSPSQFDESFAKTQNALFELAPANTRIPNNLGRFDIVSGGAITNSLLYCLSRIPNVKGHARIIEPDTSETSNLNRYALLLNSNISTSKARQLASLEFGGLSIEPIDMWFGPQTIHLIEPLANHVLVGVDHIPTRWEVQKTNPEWIGIGATTHWSAMASFHTSELPCAGCLHPIDDPTTGPIPTVAFVSFMAGLMLATYFLRDVGADGYPSQEQYMYITPHRPETPWKSAVSFRHDCPVQLHI